LARLFAHLDYKSRIIIISTTGAAALAEVDDLVLAHEEAVGDGQGARLASRVAAGRRRVPALAYRRLRPGANAALVAARPPPPAGFEFNPFLLLLVRCGNQRPGRRNNRPPSFQVVLAMEKLNERSKSHLCPVAELRGRRRRPVRRAVPGASCFFLTFSSKEPVATAAWISQVFFLFVSAVLARGFSNGNEGLYIEGAEFFAI
jgi:hypothetical protein